jgi:hypothetical protein
VFGPHECFDPSRAGIDIQVSVRYWSIVRAIPWFVEPDLLEQRPLFHVRKEKGSPAVQRAIIFIHGVGGRKGSIHLVILVQRKSDLLQIVHAHHAPARRPTIDGGKE